MDLDFNNLMEAERAGTTPINPPLNIRKPSVKKVKKELPTLDKE